MSSTKIIAAVVVAVLAIAGISAVALNSNKPAIVDKPMSKSSEVMVKKEVATAPKDQMMNKSSGSAEMDKMMKDGVTMDSMMKKEGEIMVKDAMSKTGYIPYSAESITANADGTNIIFFHAPWCPTCKAGEADINTNLSAIPAKFNILKTDFDTSTALRQKYGVTSQSTFVKVDKDGNKLSTGNGFTKLADIVAFGQK
jgi:thiol-disulfide isomerase/thioredoxin